MKKLFVLVIAVMAAGCATTGDINRRTLTGQDRTKYDVIAQGGLPAPETIPDASNKHSLPPWTGNKAVKDEQDKMIFLIHDGFTVYREQAAAYEKLNYLARERISKYIDINVKTSETDYQWSDTVKDQWSGILDYQWTDTVNGNMSGGETTKSISGESTKILSEVFNDVKLHGLTEERTYWELRRTRGKAPIEYYIYWGEFSMSREAIAEARRFVEDKESQKTILADKVTEDQNRFQAIQSTFSTAVEPYFRGIDDGTESIMLNKERYLSRYGELLGIKTQLEALGTLIVQGAYISFTEKIKNMIEIYNETERLVKPLQESYTKYVAELNTKHQQEIAALREQNNSASSELYAKYQQEIAALKEQNNSVSTQYERQVATLDERSRLLQKETDDLLATLAALSGKFEQQQENDMQRIDSYLDIIASWSAPSASQIARSEKYKVKKGDTLVKIARQIYGSGLYYPWLAKCNQNVIADVDVIRTGTTLYLPEPPGSLNPVIAGSTQR